MPEKPVAKVKFGKMAKAEMEYQGYGCQGGVETGGRKHSTAARQDINVQSKGARLESQHFLPMMCSLFFSTFSAAHKSRVRSRRRGRVIAFA